jgi:hypothetical protein
MISFDGKVFEVVPYRDFLGELWGDGCAGISRFEKFK